MAHAVDAKRHMVHIEASLLKSVSRHQEDVVPDCHERLVADRGGPNREQDIAGIFVLRIRNRKKYQVRTCVSFVESLLHLPI